MQWVRHTSNGQIETCVWGEGVYLLGADLLGEIYWAKICWG